MITSFDSLIEMDVRFWAKLRDMIFSVNLPVQSTSPVHQSSPPVRSSDCRRPSERVSSERVLSERVSNANIKSDYGIY